MAVGSILEALDRQGPIETPRFPGWVLHVGYRDLEGCLMLVARRKSDGRVLRYEEPCEADHRDVRRALDTMADRLGQEFLDLVPRSE